MLHTFWLIEHRQTAGKQHTCTMNSQSCLARPASFSSTVCGARRVSSRRVSVVRRYRDDKKAEHLKEVAQLQEAPVTVKFQPPYDLQDVLPNPGEGLLCCS